MSAFNKHQRSNSVVVLCAASLSLSLLAGCGSGGKSGVRSTGVAASSGTPATAVSRGKGQVQLTLRWPARVEASAGRYVPLYANALRFELTNAASASLHYTLVVPRPADVSQPQTVTFPDAIVTGAYHLVGTAHVSATAGDTPVASAIQDIQVNVNATTDASLTLNSTVASLEILSQPLTVTPGTTIPLRARGVAADGTTVFVPSGGNGLQWSLVSGAQTTQATITPDGVLTVQSAGTVRVRVTETGTNVFTEADVRVDAANSGTNSGLAQFSYAKFGGDIRSSGQSNGPVRTADGAEAWRFVNADLFPNGVVLAGPDSAAYLSGTQNGTGRLYARNPDGSERWSVNTPLPITGRMALSGDNTLYAPTGDFGTSSGQSILAFHASDGSLRSTITLDFHPVSGLCIGPNGFVYAVGDSTLASSFGTGVVAAFDGITGATKWRVELPDNVYQSPALSSDGTVVYVATANGAIYALNASDGSIRWSQSLGGTSYGTQSPIVGPNGTVFAGFVTTGQNPTTTLYALDGATGATKWSRVFGRTEQPVVSSTNRVFLSAQPQADDGAPSSLFALDGASGGIIWQNDTVEARGLVIGGGGGTLYADVSLDGLAAVDAGSGNVLFTFNPSYGTFTGDLSVAPNGLIYGVHIGGDEGGSLIAIH